MTDEEIKEQAFRELVKEGKIGPWISVSEELKNHIENMMEERVNEIKSRIKDKKTCGHKKLKFASGAYYIYCPDCLRYWVAITFGNDSELDHTAGLDNVYGDRVKKFPTEEWD